MKLGVENVHICFVYAMADVRGFETNVDMLEHRSIYRNMFASL